MASQATVSSAVRASVLEARTCSVQRVNAVVPMVNAVPQIVVLVVCLSATSAERAVQASGQEILMLPARQDAALLPANAALRLPSVASAVKMALALRVYSVAPALESAVRTSLAWFPVSVVAQLASVEPELPFAVLVVKPSEHHVFSAVLGPVQGELISSARLAVVQQLANVALEIAALAASPSVLLHVNSVVSLLVPHSLQYLVHQGNVALRRATVVRRLLSAATVASLR